MDCGFYVIYVNKDSKTSKKISEFWGEQIKLSTSIRDGYDREIENKRKPPCVDSVNSSNYKKENED